MFQTAQDFHWVDRMAGFWSGKGNSVLLESHLRERKLRIVGVKNLRKQAEADWLSNIKPKANLLLLYD
jgi:hypothetical protein